MIRKNNNSGISLIELLVAVAIMTVLVGVIVPSMLGNLDKAKKVKVEVEAAAFAKAAEIAYIDVYARGKQPMEDSVKNITEKNSPYYKNGTKYGNLTNWTVHNGTVAGASNGPFADAFFENMGISYGKGWKNKGSLIPISEKQPKIAPSGSMTKECVFQLFYNENGDMIVEYSRNGYFVRMEGYVVVESVKIKNDTDKHFTAWQ